MMASSVVGHPRQGVRPAPAVSTTSNCGTSPADAAWSVDCGSRGSDLWSATVSLFHPWLRRHFGVYLIIATVYSSRRSPAVIRRVVVAVTE